MSNFLQPESDGLLMRESGQYALDKLGILRRFVYMFTVAMRRQKWVALNYIDLEAGPGKNLIRETGEVVLGSPLLALNAQVPFDNFFLVEQKRDVFDSLEHRVRQSDRADRVTLFNEDCNSAIDKITAAIQGIDRHKDSGRWDSLNVAFIDPEGLEVHWDTIATLGKRIRCDLVINFSTSGITRNIAMAYASPNETAIDRLFGNSKWRAVYESLSSRKDKSAVRRAMINLYAEQLQNLSYITTEPNGEHIILNSRKRQLYCLLCASKHQLGVDFFSTAAAKFKSPQLPGFG